MTASPRPLQIAPCGQKMSRPDWLLEIAEGMLRRTLDPVVRFRLLRDVLERESGDPDRTEARAALETSCWVGQLAHDQWEDGSWGRLHTQAGSATQRIPTRRPASREPLPWGWKLNIPS